MLVINSIDKTRLSGDGFSYSGDGVAWKARVVLFMGFAAMAGGLAGGVCVMVLKYVVNESVWPSMWMGVANVIANALVMLRYVAVESGRIRVRLSSSELTVLQFRYPVGEPEHGGRLHVQPCLVRAGIACLVQCTISMCIYFLLTLFYSPNILRAFTCLRLQSPITSRSLTFTCKMANNRQARGLFLIFAYPSPSRALQRPFALTHIPASSNIPANPTPQRERERISGAKSNSTQRDLPDLLPTAPWTTATTTTTKTPPLQPPSTMLIQAS